MFLNLGDFPKRSFLKESISMLTVLAFSLMLGQFFLVRSNQHFTRVFKFSRVLSVHKLIGYSVVSIFLVHPFLIVLPNELSKLLAGFVARFFEKKHDESSSKSN